MGERRHARILSLPLVDDWIRTAVTPQVDVWAFFHAILLVRYNVYYVKLLMSTEPLEREGWPRQLAIQVSEPPQASRSRNAC